jgi:schlafen family protein
MADVVKKALTAKRESKHIEFKQSFDPASGRAWCELIKDLVAIANSGGGIIVFGLDSLGNPTGEPSETVASLDPADIANKISKYTGLVDFEFEIRALEKAGHKLIAFLIQAATIPLVFEKPGTYDIGGNEQRTAFSVGTVYFRHGAKSEPGTSEDIRRVIERQLEHIRRSWIKGVRKVVQAPQGSQIVTVQSTGRDAQAALATRVRAVNDPKAIPVRLTRDPALAGGSFVHEEVSDGIFDEINNVVDANRILAKGQKDFFLGPRIYYRIYTERQHVHQPDETIALLLRNGIVDFYAPAFYWANTLHNKFIAEILAELFLYPTNRHGHNLTRISVLLGKDFCKWLLAKWQTRWKNHPQPPSFYFTLKSMMKQMENTDSRMLAARFSATTKITIEGEEPRVVKEIFDRPDLGATLVSKACMRVFRGDKSCTSVARDLDYLIHGPEVQRRAASITKEVIKIVGDRKPEEIVETSENEA